MSRTITDLAEDAIAAEAGLVALGEEVEDEWSYVNDLEAAWRERFEALAARGDDQVDDLVAAAVERVIEETRLITDPHRAIDWMSTFPQVVLVALGEAP